MKHPQANIHPGAKIADGVEIMPFATIEDDVVIGEGSKIYPNAVVMKGARLGKNVKVFPGAVISGEPQDLKFQGEETILEVGDNTVIREFVTVSRGTAAGIHKTTIGKNCLLMAYTHVAHDCQIGNNCILVNAVQVAGHVRIDDFAIIGGTSAVHQFVHVGAHVMVSGGSLVRKDVPPYVTAGREPLAYCGVNSTGLRRRGYSADKIQEIQEIYRIIYQTGLNNTKALDQIEGEFPDSVERDEIVKFVRESGRGILRGLF
ncbi:acyl-ACP--UDP-N-acetylglucosamine O-acyltransferase [Roseivirga sp. BDSF3-8]|uniref:acyl-ACP--UDP-N-acetylglucosamine O-acyltransferase n=1 Tax=Roseivirga sp. BDSF3-8 TaxID=3241598 RepID=UPI0035321020